ncbi:hypothetical protein CWC17_10395 [Pseudoalteromonas sp. S3785]|uniref:hypothetical protein n=1 Tax=Pseudoalteromonas sp. S3785 TaxID=579545 RepID=UPI00110AAB4A|nr:hypothetical protein [Pseudoalteromonas sp. S3785]TMO73648.1 hypothetical protein CWC17_10395 [Pseudoalteromonas sp. S3785]
MDIDLKLLKCFIHDPMDINKLSAFGYDNQDSQFIKNFKQLCDLDYITSDSVDCGLKFSSDGQAFWSCVDLHITEKGTQILNPSQDDEISKLQWCKEHIFQILMFMLGLPAAIYFLILLLDKLD